METMQPWTRIGQGYNTGSGYFRAGPFNLNRPDEAEGRMAQEGPMPDTSMQMEWLGGLSREEKLEAKRLALQADFSFEGYQVVRREFISHQFDPAMTVRGTSITFNNSCISKLERATYIHFLINPTEKRLLIRSVDEGTKDAVRWCIVKGDKRKSRQISCKPFTEKLYEMMGWNPQYRYRMQGMKINYSGEDMYLFDLREVERFLPQHKDPKTGKVTRPKAVLPEEWNDSFGMGVKEHEESTKVDLEAGYTDAMGTDGTDARQDTQPAETTDEDKGSEAAEDNDETTG